ncbi:aminotransferase class V-fold PLP-dependent enzyme [Candidatus Latescibacterota bacterium]
MKISLQKTKMGFRQHDQDLSNNDRRGFMKKMGLVALTTGLTGCGKEFAQAPVSSQIRIPIPTYESFGLRPIINCLGTLTSMGGSLMLPETKMAMEEASKQYIPMAELIEAVGRRLAELSGAEWGCVTSGAAGALVAATAGCVAGEDKEKMAQLPDTAGLKNELLAVKPHLEAYEFYQRTIDIKMKEIETVKKLEDAINDRTAIIFVWGEHLVDSSFSLEDIVRIGKKYNIPILVDAAAERPDVPNVYLEAGCDLVVYSGGKCLRGPQCAGLLLGRKDLVHAASMNIAPFSAVGRTMKVGKEEIVGVVAALDLWINGRNHDAEWKEWERKLKHISDAITSISTVTTEVVQPYRPSNYAPSLSIKWDRNLVKISPAEVQEQLDKGEPRIKMSAGGNGMQIMSYMLEKGDEIPVGRRLNEILSGAV